MESSKGYSNLKPKEVLIDSSASDWLELGEVLLGAIWEYACLVASTYDISVYSLCRLYTFAENIQFDDVVHPPFYTF